MRKGWAVAILPGALAALLAQSNAPGPQTPTYLSPVDDSQQPYALYLPKAFRPDQKYPLVISLHAEETTHRMNLIQLLSLGPRPADTLAAARGFPPLRDAGYIVACPFARGTMGYQGIAEQDVYGVLADVERRYPIDEDRVYLTGVSMGGGGALWLALTRPDVWAAVAPVCAATVPGSEELAPNALNLPIRLFHGEQDIAIPPASSRAWQKRLLDAGDPVEYIEYAGVRHNAWDRAYGDGSIFDWFARHRRNRTPERVRLVTRSYRYASAYWLRIDGLTPGTPASIDARLGEKGEADVETKGVDSFSIAGPVPASPASITIDGATLRLRRGQPLSFEKVNGRWRAGLFHPAGKRAGAEGPIAEALSSRHIYVYGTADHPPPEILEARRSMAERAAAWSTPRARIMFSPAVRADSAVGDADMENANLVLFGSRETNLLVARLAGELPLALNPGAADYGLVFIAPAGKHYALVNSGLPWWVGEEEANRGGDPFAPWQFRLASTFGDFILFKGSLANVVAEGRFDRNWKVPADAAAKMLASGTVTIRK